MAVLMGEPLAHEDFRDTVNQLRRTGEVSLPSSEVCQILLEDPPQALPISALALVGHDRRIDDVRMALSEGADLLLPIEVFLVRAAKYRWIG